MLQWYLHLNLRMKYMELKQLILVSGSMIILSSILHTLISLYIVVKKKTDSKFQPLLTNILIVMGLSAITCTILSYHDDHISYLQSSLFLITSTSVLTYAAMNRIYMRKVQKELNLKVSEYDK